MKYSDKKFEEAWRNRFEHLASIYDDEISLSDWTERGLASHLSCFQKNWYSSGINATWLDVGCGSGIYMRQLYEKKMQVIGVDYSYPTIKRICSRAYSQHVLQAYATDLPFKSETFEGALCIGVIPVLSDEMQLLLELNRVVSAGGQVWLSCLNKCSLRYFVRYLRLRLKKQIVAQRHVYPWKIKGKMEKAGFTDIKLFLLPLTIGSSNKKITILLSFLCRVTQSVPFFGYIFSHGIMINAKRVNK